MCHWSSQYDSKFKISRVKKTYANYITSLDLRGNEVIKDISRLTKLTSLDLRGNEVIKNISMLTNLTS
jgi:hypothetical protein